MSRETIYKCDCCGKIIDFIKGDNLINYKMYKVTVNDMIIEVSASIKEPQLTEYCEPCFNKTMGRALRLAVVKAAHDEKGETLKFHDESFEDY